MFLCDPSFSQVARHLMLRECCVLITCLLLALTAASQTSSPTPVIVVDKPAPVKSPEPIPNAALKRWVDLDALAISTRYRLIENNAGITTNNQMQWQFNGRGRFKFDRAGKYSVYAVAGTGLSLTSGWNNTGWGTGDGQPEIFLKQLYFEAKPVKPVGVQVGGIGINNGEGTEIVGYDNDVYMMGERIQLRSPKHLYFDEVSVTFGHLGDANVPNVFRRFQRLDEWNYHQTLVRKKISNVVSISADYTYEAGRDILRQAIRFKPPKGKPLDTILFENYEQLSPEVGYGFNIFGDKQFWKRLTIGGGFARIDRPLLNGDRFPQGNRLYMTSNLRISREFSVSTALIHGVGDLPAASTPRTRLDIILTYNILESLRRHKVL
jgi:hypothetical protein